MWRTAVARWLWLATLAGCADRTQLVVYLQTDLEAPDGLDGFRTRIGPPDSDATDRRTFTLLPGAVAGDVRLAELPASFGVGPRGGDADRRVEVRVEALLGGEAIFDTRASTGFLEHRRLRLDLFLAKRCLEEHDECEREGKTCGRDGCMEPEIAVETLPEWTGEPPPEDAGSGTPPDSGTHDAGDDAGADAGEDGGVPPPESWAVALASGQEAFLPFVAVAGDGTAYVTAAFGGRIVLGDGTVVDSFGSPGEGERDVLIAAVSPAGELMDFAQWGAPGATVNVADVAWDGGDGLIVAGDYQGAPTADFDLTETLVGFVARVQTNDLGLDWVLPYVLGSTSAFNSIHVSPDAQIWGAGSYVEGTARGFGTRIDLDGSRLCTANATSSSGAFGTGAAILADGTFALSGRFMGDVDFEGFGTTLLPSMQALFVATFDGSCRYLDHATATGDAVAPFVAPTAIGGPLLLGSSSYGAIDMDGLSAPARGVSDVAVVALDGALAPLGLAMHGSVAQDDLVQMAGFPGRPPLLAGLSYGDASFGADLDLPALQGTSDGWVVAVDEAGMGLWAISVQGAGADGVTSAAWDPSAPVFQSAGSFTETALVDGQRVDVIDPETYPVGLFLARTPAPL